MTTGAIRFFTSQTACARNPRTNLRRVGEVCCRRTGCVSGEVELGQRQNGQIHRPRGGRPVPDRCNPEPSRCSSGGFPVETVQWGAMQQEYFRRRPAGTLTTVDHHAFVSAYYGNGYNSSVERPAPTLTTKDRFQVVRPFSPTAIRAWTGHFGRCTLRRSVDHTQAVYRIGSFSSQSAIPVGRRFGRCAVFHTDCPDGQTASLPRFG